MVVQVLENYHVATAFRLLSLERCNILANLPVATRQYVRSLIIKLVLATDLSQHFAILDRFKGKVITNGTSEVT